MAAMVTSTKCKTLEIGFDRWNRREALLIWFLKFFYYSSYICKT